MTKIAVFVGSLRADSFNLKLAKSVEKVLPEGVEFDYVDFSDVPFYHQDQEADYPASARKAKDIVEAADGVLFVTPEYNRSIPGILKNIIDWVSRPYGTNSFDGKPTAVIGASGSTLGAALAQSHLKNILLYLNTKLLGQPEVFIPSAYEVFDNEGTPSERVEDNLKKYVETFVAYIDANK